MRAQSSSAFPAFGSEVQGRENLLLDMFGSRKKHAPRMALVGNFAPRKCGIATFTTDLYEQLRRYHPEIGIDLYVLADPAQSHTYARAREAITFDEPGAYAAAAERINESGVDAVWLQHEYGIFGGEAGDMVCDFVDRLAAPLILTLHTVLTEPDADQRRVMEHLLTRANRIMVMSRRSRDILVEQYDYPAPSIAIIEHGAPDRPFGRAEQAKSTRGIAGRPVLMTFGLLSPGKGLEYMIEALPRVLERHPDLLYRIVGATHPNLVAHEGEKYREGLKARAAELGVESAIEWEDRFLETEELLDQLEACDIYVTPYLNLQQSTSGTLSYAVAMGKAVVSTPYIHACELLEGGVGVLVEPESVDGLARAVTGLLDDPARLDRVQRAAYDRGRRTIWQEFAAGAAELVGDAASMRMLASSPNRQPSLEAVFRMSDATGMLQHSIGIVPNRAHGYCLDDTVRALMLMNLAENGGDERVHRQSIVYASFIQDAWNPHKRAFRNFMNFDRSWCEDTGSDDANGRAIWALGQSVEHASASGLSDWAMHWYDIAFSPLTRLDSPRTIAFMMLGACAVLRARPDHKISTDFLRHGADRLLQLLGQAKRPGWNWFEPSLAYDNPRLPQALIEAGEMLNDTALSRAGLDTLTWLRELQTAPGGHFRPVGCETFGHFYQLRPFDQQPLEAQAAIEASGAAYRVTGGREWHSHALSAWRWFFGENDRGAVLADPETGLCRDGITRQGRNENCGAESILAFHLAHCALMAIQADHHGTATGDKLEPRPRFTAHSVPDI